MTPETKGQTSPQSNQTCEKEPTQNRPAFLNATLSTGLLRDAKVITTVGLQSVQDIRPGALVVTRSGGIVPIKRIERQSLLTRAIYVIAGSIGHRNQKRDSVLPADQTVLIRDWRAQAFGRRPEIAARVIQLVDGEYVRDIGLQPMTVYRLFCAVPQVIYADGMELGTANLAADECLTV